MADKYPSGGPQHTQSQS